MDDGAARSIDRRAATRRACRLSARYRTGPGWHPATLVDLSPRGCRLRVGEDLPRGSSLRVQLSPAGEGGSAPVELVGSVVWCRLEGLSHQAGIHFAEPPPDLMNLLDSAD